MKAYERVNDRKKRMEAISSGTDRKTLAQLEEDQKTEERARSAGLSVHDRRRLLIAAILVLNSNLFYTGTTAVQVGDVSYNTAQYDYYFKVQYMQFIPELRQLCLAVRP
jgi:hypothetical protein